MGGTGYLQKKMMIKKNVARYILLIKIMGGNRIFAKKDDDKEKCSKIYPPYKNNGGNKVFF
jgi:hypothetical protein